MWEHIGRKGLKILHSPRLLRRARLPVICRAYFYCTEPRISNLSFSEISKYKETTLKKISFILALVHTL